MSNTDTTGRLSDDAAIACEAILHLVSRLPTKTAKKALKASAAGVRVQLEYLNRTKSAEQRAPNVVRLRTPGWAGIEVAQATRYERTVALAAAIHRASQFIKDRG